MTALERLEQLKIPKVQCVTCVYAVELKTTLACKKSGKLLMPRYPKLKCLHYKKIKGVIMTEEKLSISEMHEYAHKLFDCFNNLDFRTTYNKALQAFYLEEGLYVVRSESIGKYQYTLVEASSEEMAIRKCM